MPYPNNLDIYDYKLTILQAEALCNTAIKKKMFYENKLKKAATCFKKSRKKTLKFGLVIKVGDKIIDSRGKIPDTTYEKYYKVDYETFVREINYAINSLWWDIEIEKEIFNCKKIKTVKKRLYAYINLKKKYEDFLQEIEITLKDSNTKAYNEVKTLYSKSLQVIDNRIKELIDRRMKSSIISWIKRVFKASKIKTPISETDLGKI